MADIENSLMESHSSPTLSWTL